MMMGIMAFMHSSSKKTRRILFLVILTATMSTAAKSQDAPLMAVANLSGAPSEMKLAELKSVLKGQQQRWKNGEKIVIALMKTTTPAGKATSSKIYGMSPNEVNKFWLALVFQGKAQAPNFFNSADDLERFLSQNPGAIGITDRPVTSPDVQTILIDGQKNF
jgi:hypothetical protein